MTDPAPYTPPPAPDYAAPAPTAASYPGKGLGIAGLVVVFFSALIGLILSIIAIVYVIWFAPRVAHY